MDAPTRDIGGSTLAPIPERAAPVFARAPQPPPAAQPPDQLGERILAVLPPWAGDPYDGGATTGEVASQLFIRAQSAERQQLNEALTSLRRAGLAKFEFDRMYDKQARWWRTAANRAPTAPNGPLGGPGDPVVSPG